MEHKRRNLLKALTIGGGAVTASKVPTSWSTPVVDSVLLPAHAETTGIDEPVGPSALSFAGGTSGGLGSTSVGSQELYRDYANNEPGLLDGMVSSVFLAANAGVVIPEPEPEPCPEPGGESEEWQAYVEKISEPVDDPDGTWRVWVKQSKVKNQCGLCDKQWVWITDLEYSSADTESPKTDLPTADSACGANADKYDYLRVWLKQLDVPGRRRVELRLEDAKRGEIPLTSEGGGPLATDCAPPCGSL